MIVFSITALLLLVSAAGVVIARNPVHSALWLILNLVGVAALYAQLNAHFLAAAQIIVYAGAIMVLVLFVLMLLNIKDEEFGRRDQLLSLGALAATVVFVAVGTPIILEAGRDSSSLERLFTSPPALTLGSTRDVARLLFTKYVFAFEVTGILLTAALIGSVMIASKAKKQAVGK